MVATGLLSTLLAGLVGWAVTFAVLRRAGRLGLIQVPNQRSSHAVPTPGGGGVGIAAGGTIAAAFAAWHTPWPAALLLVASLLIAAIGYYDDRRPLRASIRLLAQLVLFAIAIAGGISVFQLRTELGLPLPAPVLIALAVAAAVYWLNIFNFMDGIDGLAGSEAVFMLLGALLLALPFVPQLVEQPEFWWMAGLAAATIGFLLLNWPPARIFMGDAGSTYLGFLIAMFALQTTSYGWLTIWQWVILGGTFLADATVTLIHRLLRREKVFEAHRRHAYQVLSRRWRSHRVVTLLFGAINVV